MCRRRARDIAVRIPIFLSLALLPPLAIAETVSDDSVQEYLELVRRQVALETERTTKLRAAHVALDEGRYEQAVELAKQAHATIEPLADCKRRADTIIDSMIKSASPSLASASYQVREAATDRLRVLGYSAIGALMEKIKIEKNVEVRSRLASIVDGFGLRIDDAGHVCQWAKSATASTEYAETSWSAMQATGAPNTQAAGDNTSAWASKDQDAGEEWLRLKFEIPVDVSKIRIHETYNPGGIIAIDAILANGERVNVWKGDTVTEQPIRWLEIEPDMILTNEIILVLDTTRRSGWQEIDAVELVGRFPN